MGNRKTLGQHGNSKRSHLTNEKYEPEILTRYIVVKNKTKRNAVVCEQQGGATIIRLRKTNFFFFTGFRNF